MSGQLDLFSVPATPPLGKRQTVVRQHLRMVSLSAVPEPEPPAEKPKKATPRPKPLPYVKGSQTSFDAAKMALLNRDTHKKRIYSLLLARGPMTDEAMQEALAMNPNTQRPRRGELFTDGLIRRLEEQGRTKSGCRADLWEVVE